MPKTEKISNEQIAAVLDEIAGLMENQESNPYRVQAYRTGAKTVREADQPIAAFARRADRKGLMDLPGIGEGLAGVIFEYVVTGRAEVLENLRALTSSPTPQEKTANKDVLKEKESLKKSSSQPSVSALLEIDAEYRQKAGAGELPKLAPRRNNPENKAWLPVLKGTHDPWRFTALFSNTDTAHELNKTGDWVVIYYDRGEGESQVTVVTEWHGPLAGKRIVRGREQESAAYYEKAR
jgi:putative hydrolase